MKVVYVAGIPVEAKNEPQDFAAFVMALESAMARFKPDRSSRLARMLRSDPLAGGVYFFSSEKPTVTRIGQGGRFIGLNSRFLDRLDAAATEALLVVTLLEGELRMTGRKGRKVREAEADQSAIAMGVDVSMLGRLAG